MQACKACGSFRRDADSCSGDARHEVSKAPAELTLHAMPSLQQTALSKAQTGGTQNINFGSTMSLSSPTLAQALEESRPRTLSNHHICKSSASYRKAWLSTQAVWIPSGLLTASPSTQLVCSMKVQSAIILRHCVRVAMATQLIKQLTSQLTALCCCLRCSSTQLAHLPNVNLVSQRTRPS